ncbi:benzoate/H(+) symporter BenE family transporter, partial [Saccharopolyspora spinosa]|uniref:benzoate/H(+) symporter BenE family transporter n=1 Tax=Saccharopolyspora spinosa TaxID=60894 RepID=UPI00178C6954
MLVLSLKRRSRLAHPRSLRGRGFSDVAWRGQPLRRVLVIHEPRIPESRRRLRFRHLRRYALAGIGLLDTIGGSLAKATEDPGSRTAALIAFLVTASGLT